MARSTHLWLSLALAAVVAAALCALPLASASGRAHTGADVLADAHGVPAAFVSAAGPGAPLGATQSSLPASALLAGAALGIAACSLSVRRHAPLGRTAFSRPLRI